MVKHNRLLAARVNLIFCVHIGGQVSIIPIALEIRRSDALGLPSRPSDSAGYLSERTCG
jgi:hypothetical protein